jgi:hypothetical protein
MDTFEPVRELLRRFAWPGVEEGSSWGTPALKVRKKLIVRLREPGILVLICSLMEKEFLMQSNPSVYFETDHYKGYGAVLVRLDAVDMEELADLIEKTWRSLAGSKLIAEYER